MKNVAGEISAKAPEQNVRAAFREECPLGEVFGHRGWIVYFARKQDPAHEWRRGESGCTDEEDSEITLRWVPVQPLFPEA